MASDNLLLVEGPDDRNVIEGLWRHYSSQFNLPSSPFETQAKGGIDRVKESLLAELVLRNHKRIGVIVDADTNLKARWQSLRDILVKSSYTKVPKIPKDEGTIITQPKMPTVGVWIMPNNKLLGKLEHFLSFLVPSRDSNPLWKLAANCVDEAIKTEKKFADNDQIKAHLYTWLAWQKEPGRSLGLAVTARYLDADAPNAQQLMAWIKNLFEL